jgi:integrase
MRTNLTDTFVARAAPGLYWDTHPKAPTGFGLKVNPGGSRNFFLNYHLKDSGRERRLTVGDARCPIADARKRAAELRSIVDDRGDPLGQWQEKRAAPTVEELIELFIEKYFPRLAPRTQVDYRGLFVFIRDAIGNRKVADVERADLERLHSRITEQGKKRRANAAVALARLLFNKAIDWRMREVGTNPASRIGRNPEPPRERYLSEAEIGRLNEVLAHWRTKKRDSVYIIRLLLLTGARLGEVVGMTRDQLDLDAGIWWKPAPLTKQRKPHRIPLNPEAVELLRQRLADREDGRVIPLRKDDRVFSASGLVDRLEYDWRRVIRVAAGLDDVRLHDLRHSHASLLIAQRIDLYTVSRLLGHSSMAMTQRYAHLADRELREATGRVGKIVGNGTIGAGNG